MQKLKIEFMKELKEYKYPIKTVNNHTVDLILYESVSGSIRYIDSLDAQHNGESPMQLLEGHSYEYYLSDGYYLEPSIFVTPSRRHNNQGLIQPNVYVGTLSLPLYNSSGVFIANVDLEVRSLKTTYREDYRTMMEEITDRCVDLVMQQSIPVTQNFETNPNATSETLYQRFSFLRSLIASTEFEESIHQIIASPLITWDTYEDKKNISGLKKLDRSSLKQIASKTNRIQLNSKHPLYKSISSVPSHLEVKTKRDSVDTVENRFVKFAIEYFINFCDSLSRCTNASTQLKNEIRIVLNQLENWLSNSLFHNIGKLYTIPLNSPALQRKAGYRELFQAWLKFELAAQLVWKGGDDVYKAGKKDIATLYEYWVFFKMLDLINTTFGIHPESIKKIIQIDNDKISLSLKQGMQLELSGTFLAKNRELEVRFYYNRTFQGKQIYPAGGSWTQQMRPDYTLSIWPKGIKIEDAEKYEQIVHIHFDAKYKIDQLEQIFHVDNNDLDAIRQEEIKGTYKRADLLKMHAYRDAIRRTAGAYILYPGTTAKPFKGFHEILPGLGAFPLRPSKENNGSEAIRSFLDDVIEHFLNRASQREKVSHFHYEIYKEPAIEKLCEPIPEQFGKLYLPDMTVIVGYYKNEEHYNWIIKNSLYNTRLGKRSGSLNLSNKLLNATYLLLYNERCSPQFQMWKLDVQGPAIYSKQDLLKKGYPSKRKNEDYYLVYTLDTMAEGEFQNIRYNLTKYNDSTIQTEKFAPFAITITQLMNLKR